MTVHVAHTFHMESDSSGTVAGRAAASLQGYAQVRAKVEHRGPSREFAQLQLGLAVALAAYLAAFLISSAADPPNEVSAGAGDYTSGLLVLPVLLLGSLVSGARERFSIRSKPSVAQWVASTLIIGGFTGLLAVSIAGVTYPAWATLLVPVVLFVAMGAGPIRVLSRSATPAARQPWSSEPLSRPARRTTLLIGLSAGLLAATVTKEAWFTVIASAALLVLVAVFLFGWRAEWGLSHTGYEWGPIHWAALGIVLSVLFALSVLLATTEWITTPVSILAGVLALLVMVAAAVLPRPGRR